MPELTGSARHSCKEPALKPALFQSNFCFLPFCHKLPLLFLKQNAILPYFGISPSTEKPVFCRAVLQAAAARGV